MKYKQLQLNKELNMKQTNLKDIKRFKGLQ